MTPRRAYVNDDSDESLMLAYGAGNGAAFERLYQRFRKPLYGFLVRGLGPEGREAVDECFQDVWMRVIAARGSYQPTAKFSTWLFQIAHNRMVDGWRRQRPVQSLDALQEAGLQAESSDRRSPEAEASSFHQQRQMQDAIAALPADQRTALQLRLTQEMSLEEIAQITGVGRETVKSRLRYALDKLRERLGGEPA